MSAPTVRRLRVKDRVRFTPSPGSDAPSAEGTVHQLVDSDHVTIAIVDVDRMGRMSFREDRLEVIGCG